MPSDEKFSARQYRKNMNWLLAPVPFWSIFSTATTGPLLAGLLLALHFSEKQIGYVMSLTLICLPMQLIGSLIQPRFFNRKLFWQIVGAASYALFGGIALLTWFWDRVDPGTAFALFLGMFALCHVGMQLTGAVTLAWKNEVIPQRESNTFWGRFTCWNVVFPVVAGIILGRIADLLGRGNISTYSILMFVGVAGAFFSLWAQSQVPDPEAAPRKDLPKPGPLIRSVFEDVNFRKLTFCFSIQMFGNWMMCGFVFIYLQKTMNFSQFSIQILLAMSAFASWIGGYFFRFAGNRYGRKPVVIICTALKVVEFIMWGMLAAGNHFLDDAGLSLMRMLHLPADWIPAGFFSTVPQIVLGGFVNMCISAGQLSLLTSSGRKENKGVLFAVFYLVLGLVGALASCVSGEVSSLLAASDVFERTGLRPFNILSLVGAVLYTASIFVLARYRESGATPTVRVVKSLLAHNPFRTIYYAYVLDTPLNEASRASAVSGMTGNLLEDKLLLAFRSPSSVVRESAMWNIARSGDRLTEPMEKCLIGLLSDTRTGLRTNAAALLGKHGCRNAVPALIEGLHDRDRDFVNSCLFALTLLKPEEASGALKELLEDGSRAGSWPMAAEALSRIGDHTCADLIFAVYENESDWLMAQQCLLSICRVMTGRAEDLPALFEAEYRQAGTSVERMLDRIGRILKEADFRDRQMTLFDSSDCAGILENVLALELPAAGIGMPGTMMALLLTNRRFRDRKLEENTHSAASLRLQLRLWSYLIYEGRKPDETKLLAALILAEDFLKRYAKREHAFTEEKPQ